MWRFNRLIKMGWKPIVADHHKVEHIHWTNVLMAKDGMRKTVKLDGEWSLSALRDEPQKKNTSSKGDE